MKPRPRVWLLTLLILILASRLSLHSQGNRGDITGIITDNSMPPIRFGEFLLVHPTPMSGSSSGQKVNGAARDSRTDRMGKSSRKEVSQTETRVVFRGSQRSTKGSLSVRGTSAQRTVEFIEDIRPILERKCYACHGPDQHLADLRLDARTAAFRGGISGLAIIPNKAKESLLYQRVAGIGDKPQMPLSGGKLSAAQIALVEAWIDHGAQWPEDVGVQTAELKKHWAYMRPQRPQLPAVKMSSWIRNPIDNFILSRLEKEGMGPSTEASRERLIRRVSLDLIGLPPSLVEVDEFLSDRSQDAYEKLVDRLLASPHYGERWAQPWLDLARYADTHGYARDNRRSMWLYRDWVIRALNADMPFDQFTIEQIAGDLLPGSTIDQEIATGFHRNTMINEESGTDPEEFRMAAVLDRVDTTATVWLGSTLACAQCHNHKYDPFTQEEYYRLSAYFNSTEEESVADKRSNVSSRGPILTVSSPPQLAPLRRTLEDEIVRLEKVYQTQTPELNAAQLEWEGAMADSLSHWTDLRPIQLLSTSGATLTLLPDQSVLAGAYNPDQDTFVVIAETSLQEISSIRLEALTHPSLPRRGASRSPSGNFVLTEFEVEAAPLKEPSLAQAVEFIDAVADYSQKGMPARDAIDDDPSTGWAVEGDKESFQVDRQVVFIPKVPFGFREGTRLRIRLRQESSLPQQVIGRFRLSLTAAQSPAKIIELPARLQPFLAHLPASRTDEEKQLLSEHYRSVAPFLKPVRDRLVSWRRNLNDITSPKALVMKDLPQPRVSYILLGGNFLNKGKIVTPGLPAILHSPPKGEPANRLTLARWLVDKDNPLVARVTVNRVWSEFFGRGFVNTPEDFGTRSEPPTHPELLDWLSTEFMRGAWSMKAIHRLIVTSATYRQDSQLTQEGLDRDPNNKLLTRAPRLRLSAELIRDHALSVSGLLAPRVGGPSVFPPQPEEIWPMIYANFQWEASSGESRYRRGIYTFWRRTVPYPAFVTFDAPSREKCTVRRFRTNTPLQSLTTLNDPAFFDMARGLARRLLVEAPPDTGQRIDYAFRLCVARRPSPEERQRLALFLDQELDYFRHNANAARQASDGGDVKPPETADSAEFAAWTLLANILLNLDETLTKG